MPERRSALAAVRAPGRHGRPEGEAGVTLDERRGLDLVELGAWPGTFEAVRGRLGSELSLPLPADSRHAAREGMLILFPIAPEKLWLAGPEGHPAFAALATLFAPEDAVVVRLGHSRTVLRLAGPRVRDLLVKGLPLDLHPREFGPQAFAQSALHHVPVLLHRAEADAFDLYIPRGFARSIYEVLLEAGAEYGMNIH